MMEEDWKILASILPKNWRQLARETGALKGLRKGKSEEHCLRLLLIHLACGYSLRETVVRAREARLESLSDVALLKRLRKSKEWFHRLCVELFSERGVAAKGDGVQGLRLIDATVIKEPGQTGSLWRLHYSLQWPSLSCDYFKLTASEGEGTGESFKHFPVSAGEYLIADCGYSNANGIAYVAASGACLAVRLSPQNLRLLDSEGRPFDLPRALRGLQRTSQIKSWPVVVCDSKEKLHVSGRLCVVRKTRAAIRKAHGRLHRKASKNGTALQPETLLYAEYVMVFTTFPASQFSAAQVLEAYRIRWQIELVFKHFKQLANLGHLPKHDPDSARAWLYGKLLVVLMVEKLIEKAESFSPWGYCLAPTTDAKSLA